MNSNPPFSTTLWSQIVLDDQMQVQSVKEFDPRLYFGQVPMPQQPIAKTIEKSYPAQYSQIVSGIERSRQEKRHACFFFESIDTNGEAIPVSAQVEYRNDGSQSLYLTAIHFEDLQALRNALPVKTDAASNLENFKNSYEHTVLLNALPVGVAICSKNGQLLYCNDSLYTIFGLDKTYAKQISINLNDSPSIPSAIHESVKKGIPVQLHFPYRFGETEALKSLNSCHSGIHEILCNGQPIFNSKGEVENYIFIVEDITEKLNLELESRQNRQKTDIAIQAADIMFWEFDVESQLFYSDNEPLNGYNKSQPLTIEQYLATMRPDDQLYASDVMERMLAGEDFPFSFNTTGQYPGIEGYCYFSITGAPFSKDETGKVTKYVGIRKNNHKIQKQKLLQEKILNSIPVSIHIKDVADDFRYVFCNDESKRLFGTNEQMNLYDVLDAKVGEHIQKNDLEVFNTGNPYLGTEHISLKDGRTYETIVQKSIIESDGKRLLLSVRWDQSMQNELKRRSKLFNLTMEAMDAFTWLYEPETQRVTFGDGFGKTGRASSEVACLDSFIQCIHPEDVVPFTSTLDAVLEKGTGIWDLEYRMDINNDGIYNWWRGRGILETATLNDSSYQYIFGMTICIEEHKQTEMTLLRNKEELSNLILQNELILNNSNSGLAYVTTDYIVQWENISFCTTLSTSETYKKGELCYASRYGRTAPCKNCILQRTLKSRQMEQSQTTLKNGRTIDIFATPVFVKNEINGIVIRVDDVTEREEMIQALKEAKNQAEQSDRLKSAFLANMSHEIRTPLNAIVGFSELMASTTDTDEKEAFVKIINDNNELLLKLINDILDLSKIDAGAVEFKYETFDLALYFDGIAASMQRRITTPDVQFICTNPYSHCEVVLDKNRVAQLVTNFATNAIKYTPSGEIEMKYECRANGVRIAVRDTGIGIPDEKKEKVFRRFAKLDDFAQGTGLGLSICKAIAESMGGSVGFESQDGEGSLFWVTLPCNPKVTL